MRPENHESIGACSFDREVGPRIACSNVRHWLCRGQVSYWAACEDTGRVGYWCCKCHAFRGRNGDCLGVR